jgi:hypothetical protein
MSAIAVLWSQCHRGKELTVKIGAHPGMKNVRHAVQEHNVTLAWPLEDRFQHRLLMHRYGESRTTRARITVILVLRRSHRLKAAGHRHCVAVITPRRDPIATCGRVPRTFCPRVLPSADHDIGLHTNTARLEYVHSASKSPTPQRFPFLQQVGCGRALLARHHVPCDDTLDTPAKQLRPIPLMRHLPHDLCYRAIGGLW